MSPLKYHPCLPRCTPVYRAEVGCCAAAFTLKALWGYTLPWWRETPLPFFPPITLWAEWVRSEEVISSLPGVVTMGNLNSLHCDGMFLKIWMLFATNWMVNSFSDYISHCLEFPLPKLSCRVICTRFRLFYCSISVFRYSANLTALNIVPPFWKNVLLPIISCSPHLSSRRTSQGEIWPRLFSGFVSVQNYIFKVFISEIKCESSWYGGYLSLFINALQCLPCVFSQNGDRVPYLQGHVATFIWMVAQKSACEWVSLIPFMPQTHISCYPLGIFQNYTL